jgi:hypothetical protein
LDVIFVQRYPTETLIPQMEDTLVAGYSYFAPIIDQVLPTPANAFGDLLKITGREFGAQASSVEIVIGSVANGDNVTCANSALAFREYGGDLIAELRCATPLSKVGPRHLEVTVAEQVAEWGGRYQFGFECLNDFYGALGEYCVECPRSPLTGDYVAECEGRQDPVALTGWFFKRVDTDPLVCHEHRMPPYSNRTECPVLTKCTSLRDDCLGFGGGDATEEFPYDRFYLANSANVTCAVAPDKDRCRSCREKARKKQVLQEWEIADCSECYWSCQDAASNDEFNVVAFGNRCSASTTGDLCNDCVEGFYKLNNVCEVCPNNMPLLIGLGVGFLLVGAGIARWLMQYNMNYAICTIFVDYAQVVAVFVQADVPWPDELREAFKYLAALNFNVIGKPPPLPPLICYFLLVVFFKCYYALFVDSAGEVVGALHFYS